MNGASPSAAVPAPSGEGVDFRAASFGGAATGDGTLYQAHRAVAGWRTTALTPPNVTQPKPFAHTAAVFLASDLGDSIFTTEQPLSGGGGGVLNLFEASSGGALTLVSQGSRAGMALNSATFDGATPDGDFVAFDSAEPLVAPATGLQASGYQTDDYLYLRNVAAGTTELVDVNDQGTLLSPEGAVLGNGDDLVSGEPSAPGEVSPFGYLPADGFGGSTTHAISADGSKVFFESPAPGADEVELTTYRERVIHLYMRKEGEVTVQLDPGEVTPDSQEEEQEGREMAGARYVGASENGADVFFLSDEGLAGDEFKDTELYFYDTEDEKLTPISVAPEGTPAVAGAVDGVIAIANDGSRIYYVAKGKLANNDNAAGRSATEGEPNLYVYDTLTGRNTFITQLGVEELEAGEAGSGHAGGLISYLDVERPAVPTPDGDVLAFVSRADLTGEDLDETAQVYRYDATSEKLICISCGPAATASASLGIETGSAGGAIGGGSYDPAGQSAPMSVTGERIFFETESALVPEDQNSGSPPMALGLGEATQEIPSDVDVYEWENGHVYLISSGQPGLTRLQGVTPSGDDAFFTSSVSIAGGAEAGSISLYDARVGGGFPSPAQNGGSTSCESISACQGTLVEFPNFAVPATSALGGLDSSSASAVVPQPAMSAGKHGRIRNSKHRPKSRKHNPGSRRAVRGNGHRSPGRAVGRKRAGRGT